MKSGAWVALTRAVSLWQSGSNVRLILGFISLASLMVAWQAIGTVKYIWAAVFYGVALQVDPFFAAAPAWGVLAITALLASMMAFGFSLTGVPAAPIALNCVHH